jgi:hypothetical protein
METNDVIGDDCLERLMAHHEIERQIYQMGYHLEDGNFEAVAELLADGHLRGRTDQPRLFSGPGRDTPAVRADQCDVPRSGTSNEGDLLEHSGGHRSRGWATPRP